MAFGVPKQYWRVNCVQDPESNFVIFFFFFLRKTILWSYMVGPQLLLLLLLLLLFFYKKNLGRTTNSYENDEVKYSKDSHFHTNYLQFFLSPIPSWPLLCFRWLIELVSYSVVVKSNLHCSNHKFKSYHNYIIKKMVVFNMGSIFVNHIVSLWHHSILIRGKVSYMRSDRNPLVCKLVVKSFILDRTGQSVFKLINILTGKK